MTSRTGHTVGRCRLERRVGRGGMAEVWEARHPILGPVGAAIVRAPGDVAAAISWYKKLHVTPDRIELGAVLRALHLEGGAPSIARARAEGFAPACDFGRPQPPGQRARRARRQS